MGTAHFGIPVSTTHTITGAIVGVGASRRLTAVRWGVTRHIVWAWVPTIPAAALLDTGSQSVIVVTDKPHTRRVYTLWKKFDAGRGNAIVHGVSNEYNPSHWWKTPGGTTQVLHEVLGMTNASAGLSVQTGIRLQRSVAENNSHDSQVQQPQALKIQQPVDSD